ncbi:MAG: ribonucleoside-diphosphate reductase subunit alpha [Candidatus Moraniibacteriota bacterium]
MPPKIEKIQKRNGVIVDFEPGKIVSAVRKAFTAVTGGANEERVQEIVRIVVEQLENLNGTSVASVEQVQDFVEKAIMKAGFFDVAKAYILYRYEHTKDREEEKKEVEKKIETNQLQVKKRDGRLEVFSMEKLRAAFVKAAGDLAPQVDVETIVNQVQSELYDGIETKDVARTLIWTVRALIEQDSLYSHLASRLLLTRIYKEVIGADTIDFNKLEAQYREAFVQNIKRAIELEKLSPSLLDFDLQALSQALVIERDDLFRYLGTQTLHDRYFISEPRTKRALETPQMMWMRIAMGIALEERDKTSRTIEFYNVMSTLRFVPSSPTLFHAGTRHPQLSSCYLNTVKDSLDHIFKVYGDNAQLSKWAGGIGTDWSYLRATGAYIKGPGIESQGTIPFLKIANDVTVAINRSGRRRGATCVYLETWHADIEDFLELRKNTGDERRRTHDMDTANWIPDLFMKRVQNDGEWTLFSPEEVPELHDLYGSAFEKRYEEYEQMAREGKLHLTKTMKARDLWRKMLAMLFETGHPWITWKDPSNVRSPQDHVGVVHNSNLCTEITLNTSEHETAVCNLGSLNFAVLMKDGKFDRTLVAETVKTAMRMLDNVIDVNYYPTIEAKNSNMRHRPVGLGLMGFQDALYIQNINFDSEECVRFADESMEFVSYHTFLASSELAKERGPYASFKGSKWDRGILPVDTIALLEKERGQSIDVDRKTTLDWTVVRAAIKQNGMRNSNCLAMAPTATISNIAGSVPTIEPIYKNIYVKSNVSGDFIVINPYLVDELKALSLWDYEMVGKIKYHDGSIQNITEIPESVRTKYKEVFEIDPRWLIRSAAYRGKWIDQSQSLNIYFQGTSGKALSEVYLYAWAMGLKTTYYLRSLSASQVEKSTVDTATHGSTHTRSGGKDRTEALSTPASAPQSSPETKPLAAEAPKAQAQKFEEAPAPTPVKIISAPPEGQVKLCRIDDPTCEACQ